MREDDALAVLVELDNLEWQSLAKCSLCAVFLYKVLRSSKALYTLLERYHSALLEQLDNLALVDAANGVSSLELIPRIVLELLVAKAQTTVLLVDVEYHNVDVGTSLCEL